MFCLEDWGLGHPGSPFGYTTGQCVLIKITFKRFCGVTSFLLCTECPADFTYIESVNGCYKLVAIKLMWSIAGLECRALHKDAHLVVINDAQEQSAVVALLNSTNRQLHTLSFDL